MEASPNNLQKQYSETFIEFIEKFTPNITIKDQFSSLPPEIRYITGYASAFLHVYLYLQNKLPSKTIVTIDEELNEPLIQLVYNRKLSPEEEIQILNLTSKLLFKLADTEDDDRYLDIHVTIKEEPYQG